MDARTYALALSLSSAVGLRPFLTLAICAWMMYAGQIHPSDRFLWLGSSGAAAVLTGLALLEFAADKIPLVDHAMHVVHLATKPLAALLIVGSVSPSDGPDWVTGTAMAAGALNALGIHAAAAGTRVASTATTLGLGNPVVSVIEDGLAILGIVLAFTLPFVALIVGIAAVVVAIRSFSASREPRRSR
jgi:hypothetical protein